MTRNILKYLFFITIIFSGNSLYSQKIDSSRTSYSFPGVLFDNPYARQKFIGNWVIKGWDGNDDLYDSLLYSLPSGADPNYDSSIYTSVYKYQDSLVMLTISNEDFAKIVSIPGCNCSFISYYDMRNDILYANNPTNSNQNLIITRNGDALTVKLGNQINEMIYSEKSFVFEKMDKYTNGSMKLKLPKKSKTLKLEDIDKLEFELRTGKVYGDSILSNKEYRILGLEIGSNIGGLYKTLNINSLSEFKLTIPSMRVKKSLQKYWIEVIVLPKSAKTEIYTLSFKLNEKDEIILD